MSVLTPEFLRKELVENKKTVKLVADENKTYPNKVRRLCIKHGISVPDKAETQRRLLALGISVHPTLNRPRSKEEKLKISRGVTKNWEGITDEERERRSETARVVWNEKTTEEKEKMREAAHKGIRESSKNGSKLERAIYDKLLEAGFNVRSHTTSLLYGEQLECDILVVNPKVLIETDGPSHDSPIWGEEALERTKASDLKKNGIFLSSGFVVIRIKAAQTEINLDRLNRLSTTLINLLNEYKVNFPPETERLLYLEY